jgi:hypothetical protein
MDEPAHFTWRLIMKKYLFVASMLLALALMAFFVGCSDNTDNNPTGSNQSITVIAPASGVSWMVGTTHTIRWSTVNVDSVDVYLLVNGASVAQLNTANNNRALTTDSLSWTVTNNVSSSAAIKVVHHASSTIYGTSGIFSITDLPLIVSGWNGTAATVSPLGLDSIKCWFRLDSTYLLREVAGPTLIIETGTYVTVSDSIRFHATMRDNVTINENYTRWHHVNTNSDAIRSNDLLSVHFLAEGSQGQDSLYTIIASRLP